MLLTWIQSRVAQLSALVLVLVAVAVAWWWHGQHRANVATAQCQADAQAKADHLRVQELEAALQAASEAQAETQRRLTAQKEASDEEAKAQAQEIKTLRASAGAARAAAAVLQHDVDVLSHTPASAGPGDTGAAERWKAAADGAAQLLAACADRYRGLGEEAGSALEASVAAGRRCERYYDALTAPKALTNH